jgi:beta-lactamase class A
LADEQQQRQQTDRRRTRLRHGALLAAGALSACAVVALALRAPPATHLAALVGPASAAAHARTHAAAPARLHAPRPAAPSAPPPQPLQQHLAGLAAHFGEPVGIAVAEVGKDWLAQVNGDALFPQQSVSKTWVALTLMDQVDRGKIRLTDPVLMRPEDRSVFYEPIIGRIGRRGYQTTVEDLLRRAIIDSDNAANDRVLALVGGVPAVNAMLEAKGLDGIRVGAPEHLLQSWIAGLDWSPAISGWKFKAARAQVPDAVRDAAQARYLANPPDGAAPAAVAEGLAALRAGKLLSPQSTETLIDIMSEVRTGRSRLRAALPPHWTIAHKTGTGPDWRGASVGINDVALLTAPDGRTYSVAVMIRQTSQSNSARHAFMHKVVQAVVAQWDAETGRRNNQA